MKFGFRICFGFRYSDFGFGNGIKSLLLVGRCSKEGETMPFEIREKFEGVKQFLREVKTELKKVTWPSRKDALSGTAVVLIAVFIISFFLGIVDWGLSNLVKQFLGRAGG